MELLTCFVIIVITIIMVRIIVVKKIKENSSKTIETMETFTCPYCYVLHHVTDCQLKCAYNITGSSRHNCKYFIRRNKDGWIPSDRIMYCLDCKVTAKHLYCNETGKEIPFDLLSMKSLPIALLGAKASGKSNYIGVLINEIRKKMTGPFNCSLSLTTSQESEQAYNDMYYRPLYTEGRTAMATSGGETPPPLIFSLRFMDENNNTVNMAALTFYDTAGENLDDINVINKFNRYIANTSGIIMLLDPLQIPNIRDKLKANGFNALPAQNTEIYNILSRIIDVLRKNNFKNQIDIPLALVFTKTDVLEQYKLLPENSCLRVESEHINLGAFLRSDFENTNIQMQDLIGNWLDDELFGYIKQFKRHSFFGVSALGGNPNGTKIDGNGICPRRALDPLLWLLAENGFIKTINK